MEDSPEHVKKIEEELTLKDLLRELAKEMGFSESEVEEALCDLIVDFSWISPISDCIERYIEWKTVLILKTFVLALKS